MVATAGKPTRQVTRIFNEFYDVSEFDHPGGQTALSLCIGRDATELFHSSHQTADQTKIKALLAKYRVEPTDEEKKRIPANNVYDWEETLNSPFYKDLRQLCDPVFEMYGTKQNWYRTFEIVCIFTLFLWQYSHFIQGYWHSVFTVPTLIWLVAVNLAHDASHFAISKTPWINDLFMELMNFNTSTFYWYHQHIIGHHNFPNICGRDPDIHAVAILRHNKHDVIRPAHKYQHIFFPFLYPLRFPLAYVNQTIRLIMASDFLGLFPLIPKDSAFRFFMGFRVALVLAFMYVLPIMYHGFTFKGLVFSCLPFTIFSIHSALCTSFNHQHPKNDEQFSKNFYIHQVITGHSVESTNFNYWVFLYTGGLSYQLEHHLFPTVNHTHLWRIRPIVQALCKKYNIQYNISPNLGVAMIGMYDHMKKMSDLKDDSAPPVPPVARAKAE